ncbi:MAG: GNAT family N-acetyltransferase [Planctomycetales bacterium]|nr:GNAT family N-acetyltransferase [Planctomycetales bacterium]
MSNSLAPEAVERLERANHAATNHVPHQRERRQPPKDAWMPRQVSVNTNGTSASVRYLPMNVEIEPGGELPQAWLDDWVELIESSDRWSSPFWRPELITTMARIRPAIQVARLVDSGGRPFGFFPFENSRGVGEPAGGVSSDLHGVIGERGLSRRDTLHLLNQCGLKTFRFHHMPDDQTGFAESMYFRDVAYQVDLRGGWLAYQADLKSRGSRLIKRVRQRRGRIERDLGEVRLLESHSPDDLRRMVGWKQRMCERKGWRNLYATATSQTLYSELMLRKTESLRGRLLFLYAGETPVAGLYLLQSYRSWHAWNVAFAPEAARYSTGLIAFLDLMRNAHAWGLETLELSRGEERFKAELGNRLSYVCEGQTGGSALGIGLRRAWLRGKRTVLGSRYGETARRWFRWSRRMGQRALRLGRPFSGATPLT